jgi:CBS domain-containing protein
MRTAVATVNEGDALSLVLQMMRWRNFRHVPVMRGETIVGIVSERDVLRAARDSPLRLEGCAADVMSHPVRSIRPDTDLQEAASILAREKIGCLPVVSDGRLVGLLTTSDLLATMAEPEHR